MQTIDRIEADPAIMGGRPRIRGTRVTVATILGLLAAGKDQGDILQLYPYLTSVDLSAALAYAAWRLEESEVSLPRAS